MAHQMGYISPGAAFSDAFTDSLRQDAAARRQALLDEMQRRKDEQALEIGRDTLEEKRLANRQKIRDEKENSVRKRIGDMVPGDIPDASLLKDAQDVGVHIRTESPEPDLAPPAAIAAPGQEAPENTMPEGGGVLAKAPVGAIRFAGTPQQEKERQQKKRVQQIVDRLPDVDPASPEFKKLATEYEMIAGKSLPAGLFKGGSSDESAVMRQEPKSGKVQRLIDGQWVDWTKDVPKGAHWMTIPDTSARDAAREAAGANQVQVAREHAYKEFNDAAKPVEDSINRIRKMTTNLDLNSNIADSTLAEMLVTITAGGEGSGVRITRAEIDQALNKTRTNWDSLRIALNRWKVASPEDKQKADLFFNDQQRQALRDLARAYRKSANKIHKEITDARHKIDAADDIATVNRVRTRAQEDIFNASQGGGDEDETAAPAGGGGAKPPATTGKRIRYDMQGNVIKE